MQTYLLAVRPAYEKDVAKTIQYAQANGLPFAPRAGHHCVSTTMRHLKDGVLLEMRDENNDWIHTVVGVVRL